MQKISPHLWFDKNAMQAAKFYLKIFPKSKVTHNVLYKNSGPNSDMDVLTLAFELAGYEFMAINAGPEFSLNPSISFFISCRTPKDVDVLYKKLSKGGSVLMPLDKYPFSEKYAWINDKFGVSWQLFVGGKKQQISPALLFTQDNFGKLDDALKYYTTVFPKSKIDMIARYGKEMPTQTGKIMYSDFTLAGQKFIAMESNLNHTFKFNEAVSFFVKCKDQKEVDYYWNKLTKNGGSEWPCGWLKDKYGVSWQIVPTGLDKLLDPKKGERAKRAMDAMMQMKKLDVAKLKKAFAGK